MIGAALYDRLKWCLGFVAAGAKHMGRSAFDEHMWMAGAAFTLLGIIYTVTIIENSRQAAVQSAKNEMRGLGVVLAEQIARRVETLDLLLRQSSPYFLDLGVNSPDEFNRVAADKETHRFLAGQVAAVSQADTITLFGASGEPLNTSMDSMPLSGIADREFFRQLRDHDHAGLFVSETLTRHRTDEASFVLARRIAAPDGTFLGVVATPANIAQVHGFYAAIDSQQRLAVTLRRRDGAVLVHYAPPGNSSQARPVTASWLAMVAAGGGSYSAAENSTEAASIASVNPASDFPLVVDVAATEATMLKPWRDQVVYTAIGGVGISVAFLLVFGLIGRQFSQQKRQSAALCRTADVLRESEAKFRDFSDLASDWFWEQDAELRFTSGGAGSQQRSKVRAKDRVSPIGRRRWELNDTSRDPEGWESHRQTLLAHLPFLDFRFEQIDENGVSRHVSVSGVPLHDKAGRFVGYRGIGRDITLQIVSEQILRQAKERAEHAEILLQDAIDSVAEGFIICDAEGRQVVCNDGYRRLYLYQTAIPWEPGHTLEDALRRSVANGRCPEAIGRDPEWIEAWLQRALEVPSSIERPLADGRWLLANAKRMRSGGIAVLMMDISALKQAQAALRDSESHLERAQQIANIGSWEQDVASGALVWSKQLNVMSGVAPDYIPNFEDFLNWLHPADVKRLADWHANLLAGKQTDPIEVRMHLPDGDERVHVIEGRPVADFGGVIRRVEGTAQDITERRRMEHTLAQSQKMDALGQLTGGMAHDFNNTLGIIIGNLDLMKPLLGNDALASELCAEALDGAARCADLIRRLLAFARRQPLHPDRIDVNALVNDLSHMLRRTLGEPIVLKLNLDAALWPVEVDPAQLEAALVNMATNARDAMPKGGLLTISTHNATLDAMYTTQHSDVSTGDYAVIEVGDTGTGIPPEIVNHIFEPFFTTKGLGQGTGLGLAMAFGFAKQSGGHLTAYSEVGLGTTFRLYLPRDDGGQTATPGRSRADVVPAGGEAILLVEDNARLRRVAERQLTELGYKVYEADNAQQALAILSGTDQLDLLFTDVVMPGAMDGLDLAYAASRLRPQLRILLTSGFLAGQGADQRVADCPFHLLGKPYSLLQLAQAVRGQLDDGEDA